MTKRMRFPLHTPAHATLHTPLHTPRMINQNYVIGFFLIEGGGYKAEGGGGEGVGERSSMSNVSKNVSLAETRPPARMPM